MSGKQVVELFRQINEVLEPFTSEVNKGTRVWDGNSYIISAEKKELDPYALCWWAIITTICDLMMMQNYDMSEQLKDYLIKRFCGGMGSFTDSAIDEKKFGESAKKANSQLREYREKLYKILS